MCALRLYIDVYICVTSIYSLYSAIAGVAIAFFEIYYFINQTFEKSSPVLQNKTASILSMVLATVGQWTKRGRRYPVSVGMGTTTT